METVIHFEANVMMMKTFIATEFIPDTIAEYVQGLT